MVCPCSSGPDSTVHHIVAGERGTSLEICGYHSRRVSKISRMCRLWMVWDLRYRAVRLEYEIRCNWVEVEEFCDKPEDFVGLMEITYEEEAMKQKWRAFSTLETVFSWVGVILSRREIMQPTDTPQVRLDTVEMLVREYWGPLGISVLQSYTLLLRQIIGADSAVERISLGYPSTTEMRLRLEASHKHVWSIGSTGEEEWIAAKSCLEWLLSITGQPENGICIQDFVHADSMIEETSQILSEVPRPAKEVVTDVYRIRRQPLGETSKSCWVNLVELLYRQIFQSIQFRASVVSMAWYWAQGAFQYFGTALWNSRSGRNRRRNSALWI